MTAQADTPALTPRTYADLLALLAEATPWEPPQQEPGQAADGGAAGGSGAGVDLDYFTERQIAEALEIDVLGQTEDGREIEVYSTHLRRTVRVRNLSRLKYADMSALFGVPVKRTILRSGADDVPGMYSMREAVEAIGLLASQRVLSDETKLGAGCWPVKSTGGDDEDAVLIVGPNEAASYNGHLEKIVHPRHLDHLLAFESGDRAWYDYDSLAEHLAACEVKEYRNRVIDELCGLFDGWRWKGRIVPLVVSGLVLSTWVQSLWHWRPRVDVLGESGTGKSMLCEALGHLFRGLVISTADTSFPGLAQEMQRRMAAVIVDEIDAKDKESAARQRAIIKGLRSASRGTVRIRGTGGQRAVKFTLRHLAWVAGVSMNYDDQADRNRAIILTLDLPTAEKAGKLRLPPAADLADLGQKALSVALWCVRTARQRAIGLKDVQLDGCDQRAVESYAVPAAMLSVAQGYPESFGVDMLRDMLAGVGENTPVEADQRTLVAEILGATVQLETYRLSVGQAIEVAIDVTASNRDEWRKVLESHGIKLYLGPNPEIAFRYQAVRSKLLRFTKWAEHPIDQFLRRVTPNEVRNLRIGGARGHAVVYPLDDFVQAFIDDGVGDAADGCREQGAF